jgi:hypothetical protein
MKEILKLRTNRWGQDSSVQPLLKTANEITDAYLGRSGESDQIVFAPIHSMQLRVIRMLL